MLRLFTFGGLRIERDGQAVQLPTQRTRDLLAYLVTFRDRPRTRPVIAGTLWPDLPEEKARRHLSDTLWRTRRAIGEYVTADDERLWFDTSLHYWLDAEEFEQVVTTSRRARRDASSPSGSSRVDLQAMRAAADLYQGPYLDGLYHDWVLLEQERLREMYLQLLGELQDLHKQTGDYAQALTYAQRIAAAEPLHEAAHRELMRLYHLLGRDTEAIAQYKRCQQILREELDVAPAPETEALYRILVHRVPAHVDIPPAHLPAPARRPMVDFDQLPLVGHEDERSALLGHLEEAAAGRGGIVLLEGEPGIGKTRLAQEIVAGARWRNIAATVVSAAEVERASSYALYLSALAPLLTPLRIRQLTYLVESIHLQAAAAVIPSITQALPDLAPPPELPPPQARERLQQALVALVLGLARIGPHVWVLEDLQWADAETLALLSVLLPGLEDSRTLILLTGRSMDLRASPTVWDTLQSLDRIAPFPHYALGRLRPEDVGSLVRELVDEEPPTLTAYLTQGSGGVPLYVVEILKAWRDEGTLQPTPRGAWRWQGEAPSAAPVRFGEAVIGYRLGRLAHLSSYTREVLDVAAVVGTEVDYDVLAGVCAPTDTPRSMPTSDPHLLKATDELLRLGLLAETDKGYSFSHDQVRQAVYSRLTPPQRQKLHRGVALTLESLYPEQFERLAHHFAEAGETRLAIKYLARAALRSREIFAHQATLAIYERLRTLLTDPGDRALRFNILRDSTEVLGWVGDREAQGHHLEEMLELANALSDEVRLASVLHQRSEWYRLQGQQALANQDALAALKIYRRRGDDRERAALLCQLGWNVVYTPAMSDAPAFFQEALPVYRSLGDLAGQIDCLSGLATVAKHDGDYPQMFSYFEENVALAEATGNPIRIGRAYSNTGAAYYSLGDIEVAKSYFGQALRYKEIAGDRRSLAITRFYLGLVDIEHGEFETAQADLLAALEVFREVQDKGREGDTLAVLGRVALARGDPASAGEYLRAACQCHEEAEVPDSVSADLSFLAVAEAALGDAAVAWQHSQAVMEKMDQSSQGIEHPQQIYYNHSCVAQATHHWAAARIALEKAAGILAERSERIGDPVLREKYRTGRRFNRAITEALAGLPPAGRLRVRLARTDAPTHRRPTVEETIVLTWTVDAGAADAAVLEQEGQVALRRHRLLRLLAEAEAAAARPTIADLAGALDVSPRTIRTDLAELRREGHAARTRGSPE